MKKRCFLSLQLGLEDMKRIGKNLAVEGENGMTCSAPGALGGKRLQLSLSRQVNKGPDLRSDGAAARRSHHEVSVGGGEGEDVES